MFKHIINQMTDENTSITDDINEWIIEPMFTKCVWELNVWTKGKQSITRRICYRWGEVCITSSKKPMVNLENQYDVGINIFDHFELEVNRGELDYNLYDSYASDIVKYSKHMRETTKKKMEELWVNNGESAWEDQGWSSEESELWFFGKLNLKLR